MGKAHPAAGLCADEATTTYSPAHSERHQPTHPLDLQPAWAAFFADSVENSAVGFVYLSLVVISDASKREKEGAFPRTKRQRISPPRYYCLIPPILNMTPLIFFLKKL